MRPLTLPLLIAACGQTPVPPPAAPPAPPGGPAAVQPAPASVMGDVVGANVQWGDFFVRGDHLALMALYAGDAALMTDSGDVTGRDAIRAWFDRYRTGADSVHAVATDTDQLDVAGDKAYEAGTITYTVIPRTGPAAPRTVRTRYATFWRREADGRWRMTRTLRPLP